MSRLTWSVLVALAICPAVLGATKARTYRSITWDKFKESGPELKQIGWMVNAPRQRHRIVRLVHRLRNTRP